MMSAIEGDEKGIVLFKYKGLGRYLTWVVVVIFMFSTILGFAFHQDHSYRPWAFFVPVILFFMFIGYACIANLANVQVNQVAITRYLGWSVVQKIDWENIKTIKVFELYSREQRKTCLTMHIYPRDAENMQAWMFYRRKMVLGDNPMHHGRFSELIALLNTHIAEHRIPIESTVGGITTHPDHLVFIPKRPDRDPIDWYNR